MGAIIRLKLNLDNLDKTRVVKGKKGNYYDVVVSVNDQVSQYGDNVSAYDDQTKEARDAKEPRNYVGNGKVVWTDGVIMAAPANQESAPQPQEQEADFPF
jgi:hypothetical protein